jgi:hypothetical protein
MLSGKRIKAISTTKSSSGGGKKKKEKSPEEIRALEMLKDLRRKRKKIAEGCRVQQVVLDAEFKDFYALYPEYKPKEKEKPHRSDEEIACSDPRFSDCKITVYDYSNKDRRTVTWEKVPRQKKSKGVNDGYGCSRCRY